MCKITSVGPGVLLIIKIVLVINKESGRRRDLLRSKFPARNIVLRASQAAEGSLVGDQIAGSRATIHNVGLKVRGMKKRRAVCYALLVYADRNQIGSRRAHPSDKFLRSRRDPANPRGLAKSAATGPQGGLKIPSTEATASSVVVTGSAHRPEIRISRRGCYFNPPRIRHT